MFDYISITDSKKKAVITLAYSEPQNDIRNETYLYEKGYNKYSCTRVNISGEVVTEIITPDKCGWALGEAVGRIAINFKGG